MGGGPTAVTADQLHCNPSSTPDPGGGGVQITDALLPGQTAENCQDIVARMFKLKLKSLLHDLFYSPKPVLGKMVPLIYVIEWQKQGPSHAHILGICDNANKPKTIDDYDSVSRCRTCKISKKWPLGHSGPLLLVGNCGSPSYLYI